jgi:heme iron utilization protein
MLNNAFSNPIEIVKEVVRTQYFTVLSSVGKEQPYSNLVAFATTEDLKSLVFITSRNTRKYSNIMENHLVSLLIDNRTNQTTDIKKAVAITVIGSAHQETERKCKFHSIYLAKHPHLSQFVNASDSVLIVVSVSEYVVAGFEKNQRIVITP